MGTLLFGPSSEFANKNASGQLIHDLESLQRVELKFIEVHSRHVAANTEINQVYSMTMDKQ